MPVYVLDDPNDARLDPFRSIRDAALRSTGADDGVYVAESLPVLERAVAAGHRVQAVMAAQCRVSSVVAAVGETVAVFSVAPEVAEAVTGYDVHRGVIGVVYRPVQPSLDDMLAGAHTVVVLDGVTDTTNVGAIFRNCAALGADAVVLLGGSADPLYRRGIRVSMGTVFQVPWARVDGWNTLAPKLAVHGLTVVALALDADATALHEFVRPERVALVLGAEGPGVTAETRGLAQSVVRIPMDRGVDSLNVAATSAVVLWALRDG